MRREVNESEVREKGAVALCPKWEQASGLDQRGASSERSGRAPHIEMGAGIAASPHCAERRICRCS